MNRKTMCRVWWKHEKSFSFPLSSNSQARAESRPTCAVNAPASTGPRHRTVAGFRTRGNGLARLVPVAL